MIEKLLNLSLVEVGAEANNWEEAVRIAGLVLFKNQKIENRYIESMVKTVKIMGPYIVIAKGVAMPHGRPEDGVLENSLAIISLKEPVVFGSSDFDPVSLIFAICAKDSEGHIELLKDLSSILDEESLLERISRAESRENLVEIILDIYKENN